MEAITLPGLYFEIPGLDLSMISRPQGPSSGSFCFDPITCSHENESARNPRSEKSGSDCCWLLSDPHLRSGVILGKVVKLSIFIIYELILACLYHIQLSESPPLPLPLGPLLSYL